MLSIRKGGHPYACLPPKVRRLSFFLSLKITDVSTCNDRKQKLGCLMISFDGWTDKRDAKEEALKKGFCKIGVKILSVLQKRCSMQKCPE